MSGYKRATVKISEEEYRRLHQADIERRFKTHSKAQEKASKQVANLGHSLQEMEHRQRQLEHTLSNLDQEFEWIGSEILETVLVQNARYHESIASVVEETISDTDASLALLSQRFTEEMQMERERNQLKLQDVTQRLNAYDQREQSKAEAARQWLGQSAAFADFIQTHYDHERWVPGRLSQILSNLNFAQTNLAQGFYESSMQMSQQAFLQLSDLRLELEQRIVEGQAEYERARSALTEFVTELEMNSSVNAFGLEGDELPEQVDLAYWTNGRFQELLVKSRQLLEVLIHEQQSITVEELRQTYAKLIPVLREKFESLIYDARLGALNSQLRMNIAERALQALEIHGFRLNQSGYSNQDMRTAFTATLENADGSRVRIEVVPTQKPQQELTNELVMITNHPHLKTEHEARLQWQELCRSLNEFDLSVSRPEIRDTPPVLATAEPEEGATRLKEPLIQSQRSQHVR